MNGKPSNRVSTPVENRPDPAALADLLGYVKELVGWADASDGPKDLLKSGMEPGDRVEGELFEARLDACTASSIDAAAFFKAFKEGKVTAAQFTGCISVRADRAKDFLHPADLAAMTTTAPGTPRLVVSRKKGVAVTPEQALDALRKDLGKKAKGRRAA